MEVFSPVGAHQVSAGHHGTVVGSSSPANEPGLLTSSAFRPSNLRNEVILNEDSALASAKRSFPLLERLQSAIRSIEERSPAKFETRTELARPDENVNNISRPSTSYRANLDIAGNGDSNSNSDHSSSNDSSSSGGSGSAAFRSTGAVADAGIDCSMASAHAGRQAAGTGSAATAPVDYQRIEQIVEQSHRRLYDALQTDLHALHMDVLKQCLAVQKHQEHLLRMYLPQVKELAEELRVLRDENARLRARLAI